MRNYRPTRYVNKSLHLCGCVTAFDVDRWRSVNFERCAAHAAIVALYGSPHDEDEVEYPA